MDYQEFDHQFEMKEYIAKRLKEMTNLDERIMAKNVLNEVFYSLYQETQERYAQLEKRIYQEIDSTDEMYGIYTTITKRDDLDPTDVFLFPMVKSDAQATFFDWNQITDAVAKNQPIFMLRVFLEADFLTCLHLSQEKRLFKGQLQTTQGDILGHFQLKPATIYQEMIFSLYKLYINNHREWVTINSPYLQKFFDLELVWLKEPLSADNEVLGIQVDFEDYADQIRYEMVPIWNITSFGINGSDFPMPCEDHVNFEHDIEIAQQGIQNGFLMDTEKLNISAFRRTGDKLIVVTREAGFYNWEVCKIVIRPENQEGRYPYPIFGNLRRDSLVKRNVQKYGKTIKTKGELVRQIGEFDLDHYLIFQEIKITRTPSIQKQSSECNVFIKDELRDENAKRFLLIYFKAQDPTCFINRDLMSFLVSQIQLSYPEFRCEGVLLWTIFGKCF